MAPNSSRGGGQAPGRSVHFVHDRSNHRSTGRL